MRQSRLPSCLSFRILITDHMSAQFTGHELLPARMLEGPKVDLEAVANGWTSLTEVPGNTNTLNSKRKKLNTFAKRYRAPIAANPCVAALSTSLSMLASNSTVWNSRQCYKTCASKRCNCKMLATTSERSKCGILDVIDKRIDQYAVNPCFCSRLSLKSLLRLVSTCS